MKTKILLIAFIGATFGVKAQDLISGGTNSWIFHTPDDGRTSLHIAQKDAAGQWDWAKELLINNGTLTVKGDINLLNKVGFNTADDFDVSGYPVARYGMSRISGTGFHNMALSGFFGLNFYTNDAERLRILRNGNVGIGTTDPDSKLTVKGNVNIGGDSNYVLKTRHINGKDHLSTNVDRLHLNYNTGKDVLVGFGAQDSDLFVSGNVGIGRGDATEKLHVNGLIRIGEATNVDNDSPGFVLIGDDDFLYDAQYINHYGFGFHSYQDGGAPTIINPKNTYMSGYFGLDFFTNGQSRIRVNRNGNVGIGTATPDSKLTVKGHVNIGGDGNYHLKTRHIDGKDLSSTNVDRLYLNYNTGKDVVVGFGGQDSDLFVSGNIGIGTADPKATLEVESPSINLSSTNRLDANLIVQGTSTTRSTSEGASIGFVVPANSDGTNHWQQGRIMVTPDNNNASSAHGRMYLQTRYISNESGAWLWQWRDNLVLRSSGNVGIGTANPNAKLEVSSATSGDAVLRIVADEDNNNEGDNSRIEMRQDGGNIGLDIGFNADRGNDNLFRINGSFTGVDKGDLFTIDINSTNVGIGTADTKGFKLGVKGKIAAEEVKVALYDNWWPDFVFSKHYKLPTLESVEKHIKAKGHLKGVPSAKEVKKDGVFLGEMNSTLLLKIEELTLYTIQQEKEIKKLTELNEKLLDLQARLEKLESKK